VLTSSVTQLPKTLLHTVENLSPVVKFDSRSNFFTLCIAGRNSSGPSNNLNLNSKLATYKYKKFKKYSCPYPSTIPCRCMQQWRYSSILLISALAESEECIKKFHAHEYDSFLSIATCSLIEVDQHFRFAYCLIHRPHDGGNIHL
jgi:hypothetical protein